MNFTVTRNHSEKILLRGDSCGRVALWTCPDISDSEILKLEKRVPGKLLILILTTCIYILF